jgi:flagellar biosynthetic protein FliP
VTPRGPGCQAVVLAGLLTGMLFALPAGAQEIPLFNARPGGGGATSYTVPVQTLLVMTALGFVPAALVLMTSFTRILIVFSLVRQAMGLTAMPPNLVLVGLALFLTLFIMRPVVDQIYVEAWQPYQKRTIDLETAIVRGSEPMKRFMLRHTRESDLALFARLSRVENLDRANVPFTTLVPAFALSEIRAGFLIGFLIFLPFLVIDLAVASILTSIGMVMVSPVMFSLPIKIIVFTLADGWSLLAASLVDSYATN